MTVTHTDHVQRLQEEMAAITKPLSDHYVELEATITTLEGELAQLRKARTQLRQTLRAIDPELVPRNGNKPGPKKKQQPVVRNAEKLVALTTWMQERRDEINGQGGIHASGILNPSTNAPRRDDWNVPISNQSLLSACMRELHEQGVLRLDHTGNGGAKFYTVV